MKFIYRSPFSRREWIEISLYAAKLDEYEVSLLTKGVDWNNEEWFDFYDDDGLPSHEGSGLKYRTTAMVVYWPRSPFSRREWIEINTPLVRPSAILSPFSRREWIEISRRINVGWWWFCLPSHEGSGLKCLWHIHILPSTQVSLLTKGVDWNNSNAKTTGILPRLPSHEGSGLKYDTAGIIIGYERSPFSRREWIEIQDKLREVLTEWCLPSHEGSGLKWSTQSSISPTAGLPSHEGSGLKYLLGVMTSILAVSPFSRREWIEMP